MTAAAPPEQHSSRARVALAHLPEVDPGIAALALWCQYRDTPGSTQTKGDVIHLGAGFATLPLPEQIGLLSHHVLHVALRHSARRAAMALRLGSLFQPDLYDLACDGIVNEALMRAGHALPRPAVRAQEMVDRLPPEARPRDVLADWDCDQLYFALAARTTRSGDGSEDTEGIRAYATRHSFDGDLGDADPAAKDAEVWAGRVEQALAAGRAAGSGIGMALSRFGDLPQASVPWEVHLRRKMHKAFAQTPRPSHRRPAKTWLARDALARQQGGPSPVFQPAILRDGRRPRLVVGLDTSSSITDAELALFAAEALSLVRRAGAEAHLLAFDTEVHFQGPLARRDTLLSLEMRRGGGTDFTEIFATAAGLHPSLIVMLTDLDAPRSAAPRAPVIWAVPHRPQKMPHFGEVVVMRGENSSR